MSRSIGIELGPHVLRAVRVDARGGRRARVLEAEWSPEAPGDAVRLVREAFGRVRRVAVAIRLPLLLTKRVRLPPLPVPERRRALRLEPQRYFAVRLEDLIVAVRDDDLVFAARETSVDEWVRALEELGPLELVEAGPLALARGLRQAGIRDALVVLDEGERDTGLVEIREGSVVSARRIYGSPTAALEETQEREQAPRFTVYLSPWNEKRARELGLPLGAGLEPLPGLSAVPSQFLAAYGAALGIGSDLESALLPDALRARVLGRRRGRLLGAAVAALAGAAFALTSLDAWRAAAAERLSAEVRTLDERAGPALGMQRDLAALAGQTAAVESLAVSRPDPLRVLLVLSERLPRGAHLRALRLSGGEWQVEGFARQAAEVTQALGRAPELGDVRLLAATNRARIGDEMNETFALAFRLVSRP